MSRLRRPFIRESAVRDARLIVIATEDTKATVSYIVWSNQFCLTRQDFMGHNFGTGNETPWKKTTQPSSFCAN